MAHLTEGETHRQIEILAHGLDAMSEAPKGWKRRPINRFQCWVRVYAPTDGTTQAFVFRGLPARTPHEAYDNAVHAALAGVSHPDMTKEEGEYAD